MAIRPDISQLVQDTYFIDTHEHLVEETTRLKGVDPARVPCQDFAYLFWHYALSDLISAGMTGEESEKFLSPEADLEEKWRLFQPYYERCKHTAYCRSALISIRELYGEEAITEANYARITEKMRARVRKGFYKEILQDLAHIESCQVNSFEATFMESEYPTLLFQDLSTVAMGSGLDVKRLTEESGLPAVTLPEWHKLIDWYFETYGPRATAVKNQSAYARRLDYDDVPASAAAPLFERHVQGETLGEAEMKALQDHLFHYSVQRATDFDLPVKLHTGYFAGANGMQLDRVSQNPKDLCPLLVKYPNTRFVLMHIGIPYQDEMIALGKHYTNAYIDLCWAWLMNPVASARFLKEMLVAAPVNKVFTFGGDYGSVETVVGHAHIARQGIAQAINELIDEGWLYESEAPSVIERIMRGNQYDVFRLAEKTRVNEKKTD